MRFPRPIDRWLCRALLFVAALGPSLAAQAQVTQDWLVSTPNTYGNMIALDAADNVYVAGAVPWSSITLTKRSPAGALLWQRSFGNAGTGVRPSWVTVDRAGNAIVTGTLVRVDGTTPIGRIVLKYDPAGTLQWKEVFAQQTASTVRVLTDGADNVYVLGAGVSTLDNITMKYAPDGTRLWARTGNAPVGFSTAGVLTPKGQFVIGGNVLLQGTVVAYDTNGSQSWSVTTAGRTVLDIAVGPAGEVLVAGGDHTTPGTSGFAVTKYDANFNRLWSRSYPVGQSAVKVGVDSRGNVFVTGTTGNYLNWMTIKLDPGGNLLWSRTYDAHRYNDEIPRFLIVGADDAAYLTGQGGPGPVSGSLSDLRTVTLKYAPDGTQAWVATTFDSVRGLGVRLGRDNAVYVVGESPQMVVRYGQSAAPNQPPVAVVSADKTTGASPLGVSFSSAGSNDPDGAIVQYEWRFGDGTTSIQPNPYHVFGPGTYSVTLKVVDNAFASAISAPITIRSTAALPVAIALSVSPTRVAGGSVATGRVTLQGNAGGIVELRSSNTAVATVPASVLVPAGANSASFAVRTLRVTRDTAVQIIGSTAAPSSVGATLTVTRSSLLGATVAP